MLRFSRARDDGGSRSLWVAPVSIRPSGPVAASPWSAIRRSCPTLSVSGVLWGGDDTWDGRVVRGCPSSPRPSVGCARFCRLKPVLRQRVGPPEPAEAPEVGVGGANLGTVLDRQRREVR